MRLFSPPSSLLFRLTDDNDATIKKIIKMLEYVNWESGGDVPCDLEQMSKGER